MRFLPLVKTSLAQPKRLFQLVVYIVACLRIESEVHNATLLLIHDEVKQALYQSCCFASTSASYQTHRYLWLFVDNGPLLLAWLKFLQFIAKFFYHFLTIFVGAL
jgi:hypothetical protein